MVGELVGEAVGGVVRFIVKTLGELMFEIAVRGVGYLICRLFSRDADPEGFAVVMVGILFWVGVALAGWLVHAHWGELMVAH